jgi:DNA invertase Pin-like site-specific DNA recombinase
MEKFVAYYRVSTARQGHSQLGLKAQQESVHRFVRHGEIIEELTEIETGTNKRHRPVLDRAIEICRKHNAVLVIAKLDRLARNVAFVSSLMESKVPFKAVDMPEANELTIHIMAAIAQHEAKVISTRIKEALKHSEKKLGCPENLTHEARRKGLQLINQRHKQNPNSLRARAYINSMPYRELSLTEIARKLNENHFETARGKRFTATQVKRLLSWD